VFFKLANHKIVNVKASPYIKIPYVKARVNIYKTDLNDYDKIRNTIYYAKKDEYKTYFYFKNNLFKYYNTIKEPVFVMNFVSERYNILELSSTKYINNDPESMVIVTEQGKQYLFSNEASNSC